MSQSGSSHPPQLSVRALKGAPASVLWVLTLAERGCSQVELRQATGYSDKPIRRAVEKLAGQGLIVPADNKRWRAAADLRRRLAVLAGMPAETGPSQLAAEGTAAEGLAGRTLTTMLSQMGIQPPALDRLARRADLLAEPAQALAWWWYAQTLTWANNPPGLVIRRLEEGRPAPPGFLTLARSWPSVAPADRLAMRELSWLSWQAEEMAHAFREAYPQLNRDAFQAYLTLVRAAPAVLGY
jgi:predicted nucleic acid-binding protein